MKLQQFNNYIIAAIWLLNGLYCKLLGFVPRHELIVRRIFETEHSEILIKIIGVLEILMCAWILSGFKSRICSILQIVVIAGMNITEIILVPELLLFGYWNGLFALFLIAFIYWNEFLRGKNLALTKDVKA
jgi:hypothetical protein